MEVLRTNGVVPTVTFSGLTAESDYTLEYSDLITGESFSASVTAVSGNTIISLDSKYANYDAQLEATLYNSEEDAVSSMNIDIVRPYCDISQLAQDLGKTEAEAKEIERMSRYIIDSETGGFGFIRKEKEIIGNGSDYLPVNETIYKLHKLYENEELLFDVTSDSNDYTFSISKDKTSIVQTQEQENRVDYTKVWKDRYLTSTFSDGYNYLIDAEFGYKVIPQDVQEAAKILCGDVAGDVGRYTNKYIESFDNDDFKIKFAKGFTAGTGNLIVDKLLGKYKNSIRAGVL